MKERHLTMLCDPYTREELELKDAVYEGEEIVSGMLHSSSRSYPITNGIPRFVQNEGYSDSFGYQWNKWARVQFEDQNIGKPMEGHTTRMFNAITGFTPESVAGKIGLDIGCGPGRFSDVALTMGARMVALDYSTAIDAAKSNFSHKNGDILFVQGDALRMPLKDDSVDFSFTIGVLHHTPKPRLGVKEAHRVTRRDGKFAIRVYSSRGFYTFGTVKFWRSIFTILKPIFGYYPPLIYCYFFGSIGYFLGKIWRPLSYPLRALFPTVWMPDYRWSILDTFDAITTRYQSGHTPSEINEWLQTTGFSEIRQRKDNDFVARK